jgi:hypothetical protein
MRVVLAGGLLAIVAAAGALLLQHAPRRSGTDLTPNPAFVVALHASQRVCQGGEILPADTAALQLTIGTYGRPGPGLAATVAGPRGLLAAGGLGPGWRQGVVRIPVSHVGESSAGATVCLRNLGPGLVALAGDAPDPGLQLQVNGRTVPSAHLRIDYMRPGRESWLELLGTLAHRLSLGKGGLVSGWAAPGALVLMALAVALAVRTLLASAGEDPREPKAARGEGAAREDAAVGAPQ